MVLGPTSGNDDLSKSLGLSRIEFYNLIKHPVMKKLHSLMCVLPMAIHQNFFISTFSTRNIYSRSFNSILGLVFFLGFSNSISSQISESVSVQNSATVEMSYKLMDDANEIGVMDVNYGSLQNQLRTVHCVFERVGNNPVVIEYDYEVIHKGNGNAAIELKSMLDPYDLYLENDISVQYDGATINFPSDMQIGESLNKVRGVFSLTKESQEDFLLSYNVELSDRKVTNKYEMVINNQTETVYELSSKLVVDKFYNNVKTSSSTHTVEQSYVQGFGFFNQSKVGSTNIFANGEMVNSYVTNQSRNNPTISKH